MKDILLPIIAIVIWCVVSIFYVRLFKAKGYRIWLSRIGGICGGMVAALIFLIIFIPKNEKEKQEKTIVKESVSAEVQQTDKKQSLDTKPPMESNVPTVVTQPQPVPEQSNNNSSPPSLAENVKPSTPPEPVIQEAISLDEAKSLAGALNDFMEKMERLTLTGVETDDFRGIKDYVSIPLKKVRQHFDDKFVGGTKPEPIALFLVCSDAAMHLQHYVDDILDLKPGVYKAQRLEQDLNLYSKNKEDCALLVNESDKKTNSRWKVRMQQYKKLVDSLGGEDCFTVYTVDGTAPKPAHCKK
ncbi:TPA: hypothetical protein I8P16_000891 [Salmonella enterica subsp. enterica serovar Napoli]|uniref:Uncharacterized protein n=1 Tax=Salmonella enterica subsp. salamae TaxID=59202 RepID=A0A5Y3MJ78_SALER|nr:hypothetical protein [Salmonella enterica]EBQ5245366.1 hypothetical protein [Salmonella enterica subsp. salamae]ECB4072740.1 hypothetical protein [Salmonella enterica subsp. enterica serovar Napoli]EAO8179806.1 hypothetical protein [Salmonella enterica]ECD4176967.1 hypothetical protein [Salmonella enterica subsp. enterica serovar Napoli]ECI4008047.1 hypothetical protein [Salmonella enterica subsp. salamae]